MICVVIKGPSIEEAHSQMEKALPYADLVELRLDLFHSLEIKSLRERFSLPMIFTIKREDLISKLLPLRPEYIDLDINIAREVPETKLIVSYHNFTKTPEDLEGLYRQMRRIPATYYKIAVQADSILDTMRLIAFAKEDVIAISMGLQGQVSRLLSPITYVALDESQKTASGQFLAADFPDHSFKNLYGLIGDPVEKSISDQTHNGLIQGSYVKMQVKKEELPQFLHYARKLRFSGLSVTMPLKEAILPFLDHVDSEAKAIGAVNTVVFRENKLYGYNTDGKGALNAIGNVKDKHMVLIGTGGAAKAIAFEALKRGARVTLVKRNAPFPSEPYDILINCTPVELPIDPKYIRAGTVVMDITTKPKETEFLKDAIGCQVIYGYQMFIEQALGQFQLWGQEVDRKVFERKVELALSHEG